MSILGRKAPGVTSTNRQLVTLNPAMTIADVGKLIVFNDGASRFDLVSGTTSLETLRAESWGILVEFVSSGSGYLVSEGFTTRAGAVAGQTFYVDMSDGSMITSPTSTKAYAVVGASPSADVIHMDRRIYRDELLGNCASAAALQTTYPAASFAGTFATVDNLGLYEASGGLWVRRVLGHQASGAESMSTEIVVGSLLNTGTDHSHYILLTKTQLTTLYNGTTVTGVVSSSSGSTPHTHTVDISFDATQGIVIATIAAGSGGGHTGTEHTVYITHPKSFAGDSGSGGKSGLVPAPTAGDSAKFLSGSGSWVGITTVPTPTAASNLLVSNSSNAWIEASVADVKTALSLDNVENTAVSTWTGSLNITTLGTITTGAWGGSAISDSYISSAETWNAKLDVGDLTVSTAAADGGGSLTYSNGTFTFTPSAGTQYANFGGDLGTGGTAGLVPAPAQGDSTKFLQGDGSWGSPAGASYTVFGGDVGAGGSDGLVPAPAIGDSSKFLKASGGWADITIPTIDSTSVDNAGAVMVADTSISGMGFVLNENNLASNSTTKLPTQASVKAYVDATAVGLYKNKGAYNANTNVPNLDTTPIGTTISNGDVYTVEVAGNFFSEAVAPGDVLIANQDSPTLLTHWTRVNKNISFGTTGGTACEGNDSRLSLMTGASAGAPGTAGRVPAPASGDNTKYLKGDGSWADPNVSAVSGYDLFITSTSTSGGVFTDSSASKHPITTSGGAANSAAVVYPGKTSSMLFNTSGDYLTVGNAASLNVGSGQFAIGGRFRTTSLAAAGTIFGVWGTTAATKSIAVFVWNPDKLMLFVSNGAGEKSITSSAAIAINTWYKWEVVCDGVNYLLFLNDVQVGLTTVWAGGIATYAAPLQIGRDSTRQFHGNIDTFYMKLGTTARPTNSDLDNALLGTTPVFGGDFGSGGTEGLVPAPAAGDSTKFLSGAGSWTATIAEVAGLTRSGGANHVHSINLTPAQVKTLIESGSLVVTSNSTNDGSNTHTHSVTLTFNQIAGTITGVIGNGSVGGHLGTLHGLFAGSGGGSSYTTVKNTVDWSLTAESGYTGMYETTVTHNLGLASSREFICQCFDTSGWLVQLDVKAVNTNSFKLLSVVTINDLRVSVR